MSLKALLTRPAVELADLVTTGGVAPGQIELAVMTHLHVDHASGMADLPRASFVCSSAEWRAGSRRLGALPGYVRRQLPDPSRVRKIDFDSAAAPYGPFDRTVDLLGDGSVRLVFTPGHTAGHLSVLVQLRDRQALVAGDALFTRRNLRKNVPPFLTADEAAYHESVRQIWAFCE